MGELINKSSSGGGGRVRARPRLMTLTPAAIDRLSEIVSSSDRSLLGVRVGVEKGGCAGMSYRLDPVEEADPLDEMIEEGGIRLYIDKAAILFLLGTEMDYKVDRLSSGFVFKNPNETSACGCGESVSITPASSFE